MRMMWPVLLFGFMIWASASANAGHETAFAEIAGAIPAGDKLGHLLLYGGLTYLTTLALGGRAGRVAGVVALMMVIDEGVQAWFPTRTVDGFDVVASGLGILIFSRLAVRRLIRRPVSPRMAPLP